MDTPVVGWMTGAQKCMCVAGGDARALMAALQYERGDSSAMRGDRRCWTGGECVFGWLCCGRVCGVGAGVVGSGVLVGVSVGSVFVGGVLARVCFMWMRGAALATCGAVGFVDIGRFVGVSVGGGSPFEVGHGSESSS